jgi:hypothetical protein
MLPHPCSYRTLLYYGYSSATAAVLVDHLEPKMEPNMKMHEHPSLSPQPSYEADTESGGASVLGTIYTQSLPSPDFNLEPSTFNLNDEAVPVSRPMSTKTFPLDVFTSKDLVCIACSSFILCLSHDRNTGFLSDDVALLFHTHLPMQPMFL